MSRFELKLPKMGESVAEATITSWLKEVGDTIEMDEAIVEIATDKVDSEVPSEVGGVLVERLFEVDDVVGVGQVIAVIETNGDGQAVKEEKEGKSAEVSAMAEIPTVESVKEVSKEREETVVEMSSPTGKFYSPLVKNIARTEGVSMEELESITGTGKDNRVTKNDILAYIENRSAGTQEAQAVAMKEPAKATKAEAPVHIPGPSGSPESECPSHKRSLLGSG